MPNPPSPHRQPTYPIGTPGNPWGKAEKLQWQTLQKTERHYAKDVLPRIEALADRFSVQQYGELHYQDVTSAPGHYPLFAVHAANACDLPLVVITGGVHGYETSGVMGALLFLETVAQNYLQNFQLLVAPCVSPWGYETINRWNPAAVDPNRSFGVNGQAPEAQLLKAHVENLGLTPLAHIDLHETTDTDNSEFRPALAARDGVTNKNWNIPDGFYLVDCSARAQPQFQRAILDEVAKVTHIAEADENGKLIGTKLSQHGVIEYATQKLGLCAGMTQAPYTSTTEVYPDSPNATPAQCANAQVAAIVGGLNFLQQRAGS
ncbi:M14 family metallocarboxypeptidase [Simiduia sp. 21SJ11W-1]|uniref:M14 family metallopeptidase n=1 Tax=Simiduia sp. 21SJ11W-1 TaxID=2909669 RepID=UPI00209E1D12|nr:M14 family metallocarboxypeptidase [Simiduia sp. 21SJ11W-1]UTA47596.1 M14 family metallocarboxypeptidase [Simiduia sp. 21SJ11W-1]